MKPKSNQFRVLIGLAAVIFAGSASAASVDVVTSLAPVNTTTGSGVRGVNALTTSQTWTANNEYFITDRVFIPDGVTLTIEPGTKIYASSDDLGTSSKVDDKVGSLIAVRGGRLVADGTAASPIVFTSVREWEAANNADSPFDPGTVIGPAPTKADAGQWGGVVLLGNAYINHLDGITGNVLGYAPIEGFVPASTPSDDGDTIPDASQYGFKATGPYVRDDADDSGVLRFISIRHGGYEFAPGREINGLTLGGVGAGTVIDHIEVFANQDDGIEFFGGTVSASYLALAYNQDDNFDFDSGYTGTLQFIFSITDPGFADGGFEADGIEGTTASQAAYDAAFEAPLANRVTRPGVTLSKPLIYNATIVGPGRSNTFSTIAANTGQVLTEKGNYGLIFDDYFNGEIYNSVFDDFAQDLLFLRDAGNKSTGATAAIAFNTIGRFGTTTVTIGSDQTYITGTNTPNLVYNALTGAALDNNSAANTNPGFTTYTRNGSNVLTAINPLPSPSSPLLKTNGATLKLGAPTPVAYRGAFGNSNWAAGWTKFSTSGILLGAGAGGSAIVDSDNDGISDALEAANSALGLNPSVSDAATVLPTLKTAAQFTANFTAGQTSVTNDPVSFSLYTASSIQNLRGTGMMIGPVTPNSNTTLTLPLFSSPDLTTWTAVGNATATVATPPGKRFFRVDISLNAPNP